MIGGKDRSESINSKVFKGSMNQSNKFDNCQPNRGDGYTMSYGMFDDIAKQLVTESTAIEPDNGGPLGSNSNVCRMNRNSVDNGTKHHRERDESLRR